MHSNQRHSTVIFGTTLTPETAVFGIAVLLLFLVFLLLFFFASAQTTQAQTYRVLHNFAGDQEGAEPDARVTLDLAGNVYGTTNQAGSGRYGTVYRLKRTELEWDFGVLYAFTGGEDGGGSESPVTIGPDGNIYGATWACGSYGLGTVFKVRPAPRVCPNACGWSETTLHSFSGGTDGGLSASEIIFDQAGKIYGSAGIGGLFGGGLVYQLSPSGDGWIKHTLYNFAGGQDGGYPLAGLIFDKNGNLYGTTVGGGDMACNPPGGCGTVFQLRPSPGIWTKKILYSFHGRGDGQYPAYQDTSLMFDEAGNLYGVTSGNGEPGSSTVFQLSPPKSGGDWAFKVLHSLDGEARAGVTMDSAGNLYGTLYFGGTGCGAVFKLSPEGDDWQYSLLHVFSGNDGCYPWGSVVLAGAGNIYGATQLGGAYGGGVVYEIRP